MWTYTWKSHKTHMGLHPVQTNWSAAHALGCGCEVKLLQKFVNTYFQCPYLSLSTSQLATRWVALGESWVNCRLLRVSHCQESVTSRTFGGTRSGLEPSEQGHQNQLPMASSAQQKLLPRSHTCPPAHRSSHWPLPTTNSHISLLTCLCWQSLTPNPLSFHNC